MRPSGCLRTLAVVTLALGLTMLVVSAGRASAASGPVPDVTSMTVTTNPLSSSPGSTVTITALVKDVGATPSPPTGSVSFSDAGAGGTFTPSGCTLSTASGMSSSCSVSYAIASTQTTSVTIHAIYIGDSSHLGGTAQGTLGVAYPSSVSISPRSLSIISGRAVNFTATVSVPGDSSAPAPTGTVDWSDGGVGGNFTASECTLGAGNGGAAQCWVVYNTAPGVTIVALPTTITASYSGDNLHAKGSGTAGLQVLPAHISIAVSYAVVGSPRGSFTPVFTYLFNNQTKAVAMSAAPSIYQVDTNSIWFAPNQLGNSTSDAAWNLLGNAQGTASYGQVSTNGVVYLRFVYYHQYRADLGYRIVGGTAGASVPPFTTYTSFGVTRQGGSPGTTWVDVGTSYSFPPELPGSLGAIRWLAVNVTGVIDAPGDYSVTYYHQYSAQVSYSVVNSPSGGAPSPTFFGMAMGTPFNATADSLTSRIWLDAGSAYSFTNPLLGSNSTVRWDAGSAGSGIVIGTNIDVSFYKQYPVVAYATMFGTSAPTKTVGGTTVIIAPSIVGVSGGRVSNFSLASQASSVWLDAGTTYSIPSSLSSLPTERWVAAEVLTGTVIPGAAVNQTYYQQYLIHVKAAGSPSGTDSFQYRSMGVERVGPLDSGTTAVWADTGTSVSAPPSTAVQRWSAGPGGTAASANATVEFFQQYRLNVSIAVAGGGLPAPSHITGTSGGQPVSQQLVASTTTVWLDAGSSYNVPRDLLVLPQERWVAEGNLTGSVVGPGEASQTYYHQDMLNITASGVGSASGPTVSFVAFGASEQKPMGSVWADVGTPFSVQNVVNGATGERWYADPLAGNVTLPVRATLDYYAQDLLTYQYTAKGGALPSAPELVGVQAGKAVTVPLTSVSGGVWLDSGSHWEVALGTRPSAGARWLQNNPASGTVAGPALADLAYRLQYQVTTTPSPKGGGNVTASGWFDANATVTLQAAPATGWTLGGWDGSGTGAYAGTNSTVSIWLASPLNETVQFEPSLTIISANGGNVRYTTGPSVRSLEGGRSVQTYIPSGGNVTLQAHAAFPYQFVGWSGITTGSSNPVSLSPDAPMVVQAVFAPDYLYILGLPALVFASTLSTYLARRSLLQMGRTALRSIWTKLRGLGR